MCVSVRMCMYVCVNASESFEKNFPSTSCEKDLYVKFPISTEQNTT